MLQRSQGAERAPCASALDEPRLLLEVAQAVPREVHDVRRDGVTSRLSDIEPPLPYNGDHPDERARVHGRHLRVIAAGFELTAEDVLDLGCDVVQQAPERSPAA